MSVLGYVKGCIFCGLLFFAAFFGLVFIMFPSLILLLFKKNKWFRLWNDYWGGFWLTLPGVSIEHTFILFVNYNLHMIYIHIITYIHIVSQK